MERDCGSLEGEVSETRVPPGWERVRAQDDSEAVDAVGPEEIAKAAEGKDTVMPRRGVGCVEANGSSIENYGENKIVGFAKD